MLNKLRFFYFDILRKFNDDLPSKKELEWVYIHIYLNGIKLSPRISDALTDVVHDHTLEDAAKNQNVTRERIRQYLLKACRIAREKA